MSKNTLLFSCSKCINKIPTDHVISNTYNQCDCDITSDDYDAYVYESGNCECEQYDFIECDRCNNGSFLHQPIITCFVCGNSEKTCCLAGYSEIIKTTK